jgi:hypothetical protein
MKYGVCIDPKAPVISKYRNRILEKWEGVNNTSHKLVRNYTKCTGELLPCHKEMIDKGFKAVSMLLGASA